MSTTINPITNHGLFNVSAQDFQTITDAGNAATINADLTDCKDAITVIVEAPVGVSDGTYTFSYISNNQKRDIPLTKEKLNVFCITTKGIKQSNGTGIFLLTTTNSAGFASLGFRVAFLKYTPVINH